MGNRIKKPTKSESRNAKFCNALLCAIFLAFCAPQTNAQSPKTRREKTPVYVISPILVDDYVFPDLSQFAISTKEAKIGVEALRDLFAREGLPQIFVNRNADSALRVLEQGYFGTLHTLLAERTDIPPDIRKEFAAAAAQRRLMEKRRGTFGDGQAAGQTVYGSVQLGDRAGRERFIEDVIRGMRSQAPRPTKPAQGFYLSGGAVTFVMKPSTLIKATFLGCDSFLENEWMPGDIRRLPEITMTALARIASGHAEVPTLRLILRMPVDKRREALRRVLASDIFQIDYIEAQIRQPSVGDVDHILIKNDVKEWPTGYYSDPRAGPHAQALMRVREMAIRRGIPLIET